MSYKFITYCKFFSAFGSSSCNNFSAVFSCHSFSETVLVLSLPVAWLICSFHFLFSLLNVAKILMLKKNFKELMKFKIKIIKLSDVKICTLICQFRYRHRKTEYRFHMVSLYYSADQILSRHLL
jgi:hypothetical protein